LIKLIKEISPKQQEWRNHPAINAFTRQNGILSATQMMKWREKIEYDPTIEMFGIEAEISHNIDTVLDIINIGTCGLTSISQTHGTAEFSLLINPQYHRQGYGRAALIELLKYGFKNLRLNTIFGETFCGNPALKMFKELGMVEEGTARERYFKNGKYTDSHFVSILAREAREQSWWS
jgi:RimJ/RimL family protein N-acetyltransferase